MNSMELIALGIANAREMFKETRNQSWLRIATLYMVAKDSSPLQRGKLIGRLLTAETDLLQGKEVKL